MLSSWIARISWHVKISARGENCCAWKRNCCAVLTKLTTTTEKFIKSSKFAISHSCCSLEILQEQINHFKYLAFCDAFHYEKRMKRKIVHLISFCGRWKRSFFYAKAKSIFDNPLKPQKNHSAENILPLALNYWQEHNRWVSLSVYFSARNLFGRRLKWKAKNERRNFNASFHHGNLMKHRWISKFNFDSSRSLRSGFSSPQRRRRQGRETFLFILLLWIPYRRESQLHVKFEANLQNFSYFQQTNIFARALRFRVPLFQNK